MFSFLTSTTYSILYVQYVMWLMIMCTNVVIMCTNVDVKTEDDLGL